MTKKIDNFFYQGSLIVNPSKSYLQRALAISSLAKSQSDLIGCDKSDDVVVAKNIIKKLGSSINGTSKILICPNKSQTLKKEVYLNASESALSLNIFAIISSLYNKKITINGTGSLLNRSINPLLKALTNAGVKFVSENNKLPIQINGNIKNRKIYINGISGSQVLSGFLICLPLMNEDSIIEVENLVSKPYIDMTLEIINDFGVSIENINYKIFKIKGNQKYYGREYKIEGDWSGASNHLVGGAISGKAEIKGLNPNSKQADRKIIEVLEKFGADINIDNQKIIVSEKNHFPFNFDASNCPDLFPILTVLASKAVGISEIIGIKRLKNKESNRLETIIANFSKIGLDIKHKDNALIINGIGCLNGGKTDSFNDHRIAMALAIASSISKSPIYIKNHNAINKSYPNFYRDLEQSTIKKPYIYE